MSRFLSKLTGKTRIVHVFTFTVHQIQGLSSGTKEVAIQISRKGTNKLQTSSPAAAENGDAFFKDQSTMVIKTSLVQLDKTKFEKKFVQLQLLTASPKSKSGTPDAKSKLLGETSLEVSQYGLTEDSGNAHSISKTVVVPLASSKGSSKATGAQVRLTINASRSDTHDTESTGSSDVHSALTTQDLTPSSSPQRNGRRSDSAKRRLETPTHLAEGTPPCAGRHSNSWDGSGGYDRQPASAPPQRIERTPERTVHASQRTRHMPHHTASEPHGQSLCAEPDAHAEQRVSRYTSPSARKAATDGGKLDPLSRIRSDNAVLELEIQQLKEQLAKIDPANDGHWSEKFAVWEAEQDEWRQKLLDDVEKWSATAGDKAEPHARANGPKREQQNGSWFCSAFDFGCCGRTRKSDNWSPESRKEGEHRSRKTV